MTNQEMLISYINKLTEDKISSLLKMRTDLRLDYKYHHGKFALPGICLEGDGK